ncbi:hypothetical protein R6Q57_028720 [Mikania cordata]
MASASRSAIVSGARTIVTGSNLISRTLTFKSVHVSPFLSSTRTTPRSASRIIGALGTVESMMPLHSAIASARLRSIIGVESTCWSWLSQVYGSLLQKSVKEGVDQLSAVCKKKIVCFLTSVNC